MAKLTPFRALRPAPEAAAKVSSVPYDVVSREEARAAARGNPLSFLHVTRSEIDLPDAVDPYADAVYARARENLATLKGAAPLVVDEAASLYLYRLKMGAHAQTGVAGCFSIDEYEHGSIRKHERTRKDKEDDRTRHIVEVGAQTGVVFLTHRSSRAVDAIARRVSSQDPLFDFTAADGVAHTLWRTSAADRDALVAAFAGIPELYIADGHHRAASAWRARMELASGSRRAAPSSGSGEAGTFLAVAFPDDQMQVLPYNRVVRDLADRSPREFLAELGRRCRLLDGRISPSKKGEVAVYLAGTWHLFELAPPADPDSSIAGLDVQRLQDQVLSPLLGVGDPRTDKRIDFVGGIRGAAELERRVDSGKAAAAFSMFPVTVADLFAVADAGDVMPPKSTWFEPKLRDGLLVHEI